MPRVVLDPNVLVSALITPEGTSAQLLAELRDGAFELVTSSLLLTELADVLRREKFRRYVTPDEATAFVTLIRSESTVATDPKASSESLSEDPGDEYLIALARAARVDALVSGDSHLTALSEKIPVQTPRDFLDSLKAAE